MDQKACGFFFFFLMNTDCAVVHHIRKIALHHWHFYDHTRRTYECWHDNVLFRSLKHNQENTLNETCACTEYWAQLFKINK